MLVRRFKSSQTSTDWRVLRVAAPEGSTLAVAFASVSRCVVVVVVVALCSGESGTEGRECDGSKEKQIVESVGLDDHDH